jgi:hypothetical protein
LYARFIRGAEQEEEQLRMDGQLLMFEDEVEGGWRKKRQNSAGFGN